MHGPKVEKVKKQTNVANDKGKVDNETGTV